MAWYLIKQALDLRGVVLSEAQKPLCLSLLAASQVTSHKRYPLDVFVIVSENL
jgi:hypothetical protein